jgi:hypothetical protein
MFLHIETGRCNPEYAVLARALGIKERWLRAIIGELRERGWISQPQPVQCMWLGTGRKTIRQCQ